MCCALIRVLGFTKTGGFLEQGLRYRSDRELALLDLKQVWSHPDAHPTSEI